MMRRMFFTIYATLIGALALFAVIIGLVWFFFADPSRFPSRLEFVSKTAESVLPKSATPSELEAILNQWADVTQHELGIFTKENKAIAISKEFEGASKWRQITLSGDRVLKFSRKSLARNPLHGLYILIPLSVLALAVALAAYPLMRRITCRLEALRESVALMGEQRGVRVKVEGKDEIASLARLFNSTSEKIDTVISSQKLLLANASHELRSPLTRLKLAVESLETNETLLKKEINTNIFELDALIEEILLNSRLESKTAPIEQEVIDISLLAKEEGQKYNATLDFNLEQPLEIIGETRLIRRMIKNLLENAVKYGESATISLKNEEKSIVIAICDKGNGIAKGEEEKIFEPFFRQKGMSEAQGGVGLGLTLVKQIAEQHQGSVRVYNSETGGACFEVRLPRLQPS